MKYAVRDIPFRPLSKCRDSGIVCQWSGPRQADRAAGSVIGGGGPIFSPACRPSTKLPSATVLNGARFALTTFTVLRSRQEAAGQPIDSSVDRRTARWAMLFVPLVGAALAVVAGAVMLSARLLYEGPTVRIDHVHVEYLEAPILAASLAIVTLALLTRGMHLAGLANTVDTLTSRRPAEHVLALTTASDDRPIGSLGAAALVGCLLVEVLALGSSVLDHHGTQSLLFGVLTGRLAMVWACTPRTPPARSTGFGALIARTVPWSAAICWTVLICIGAGIYGRYDSDVGSPAGALRGVAAVLVALAVSWIVRRHIVRKLGGISGDVLGALCEIATVVSLLVTAAGTR